MDYAAASLSGYYSQINTSPLDMKTLIESVSAIGTFVAAVFAGLALRQSNKQLKIEQTPYIVLDHIRKVGDRFGFAVKNIGRGSAINITFSIEENISSRNDAFFSDDQPHSANFRSMEESHYWKTDASRLDNLIFKNGFAFLYIFFEDQSFSPYRTKVKIKSIGKRPNHKYIVMENYKPDKNPQ